MENRAEFVTHAAEHSLTVAGAVQCKECAASFTVPSTLYRHLRIVHRIDCNIDTYLRENGAAPRCPTPDGPVTDDEEITSPADLSSSSSLTLSGGRRSAGSVGKVSEAAKRGVVNDEDDDAPAECTVCYRVFLSRQLLRAHMRVHGMAFIQRTRRSLPVTTTSQAAGSLT